MGQPIPVTDPDGDGALEPIDFLHQYEHLFGITDPDAQLSFHAARTDSLGHTHTIYHQRVQGVPVFSGVLKVHQDGNGNVIAANGDFYPIKPDFTVVPTINANAAAQVAVSGMEGANAVTEVVSLVIVDPGWYGDPATGPKLAYHVVLSDSGIPSREAFFVDAHTSEIIDQWSVLYEALDRAIYNGNGGPALPGTLIRAEGDPPVSNPTDANRAYDYAQDTYGYFLRAFGRDSLDDLGLTLIATVNSTVVGCPNAIWNGTQAAFCLNTVGDEHVAHEFTHGLTQYTADLIYQNQSGQLNESFSDVFGELVDLFNGNAAFAGTPSGPPFWPTHLTGPGLDTPNNLRSSSCSPSPGYANGVRWLFGESTTGFGGPLRDMWNPPCYSDPDRANSTLQTCSSSDSGGVHTGSGILNHAFAMVTDGKTFNGRTVFGIGPIKSGAVWYRALNTYLTVADDFEDAYAALNQAAADLVGTFPYDPRTGTPSSSKFTDVDADQVEQALKAVELNTAGRCGSSVEVLLSDPAVPCAPLTSLFFDDFETGMNGWTVSNAGPAGPPTPYNWQESTEPLPFGQLGVALFVANDDIGDCAAQNESAVHSLMSPTIVLPSVVTFPRLSFVHYMASDPAFDGGNVKIRVNGGSWQVILPTDFEYNPYNNYLLPPFINGNPLAGQMAWTGVGGRWGTSVIDLSSYVVGGETLELRFDFGKDGCFGVEGWYVDDVHVYDCTDCNGNSIVDNQEFIRTAVSGPLSPLGFGSPQSFILVNPPPAAGNVLLDFRAYADLGSENEYVTVSINGFNIGTIFDIGAADCPLSPNGDSLLVSASLFNLAISGDDAEILMVPSAEVAAGNCTNTFIFVFVKYETTKPDCGHNHQVDACESDCQPNGTPDSCEFDNLTARDCNLNIIPDECDIASGTSQDVNQNGVPDECGCVIPKPIVPESYSTCPGSCYARKNRYLSFIPPKIPFGADGVALRITCSAMPGANDCPKVPDYSAFQNAMMWVGEEALVNEITPTGVYRLRDTPLFRNWSSVPGGVIHVSDCNIVPCATYTIETISDDESCDEQNATHFSSAISLPTSVVWADIVGIFNSAQNRYQPADGDVDFVDVGAAIDTFKNKSIAPPRTWCDVHGNQPTQGKNLNIDFFDITVVIDAFQGKSYPFAGPTAPNACVIP